MNVSQSNIQFKYIGTPFITLKIILFNELSEVTIQYPIPIHGYLAIVFLWLFSLYMNVTIHKHWWSFCPWTIWYDPSQYPIPIYWYLATGVLWFLSMHMNLTQSNTRFQYIGTPFINPDGNFFRWTIWYDSIQYPIPIHGYLASVVLWFFHCIWM